MNAARRSLGVALLAAGVAYVMVGPWPCERSFSARCGTVAFDYGSDATFLPYQALVTMVLFALIGGLGTWFWIERERSPLPVRVGARTIMLGVAALAVVGIGGLFGIGAPFVVPLLWLVARHSETWERLGWTLVASLCAAAGSWIVAIPLGSSPTMKFAVGVAAATAAVFLMTTRRPRLPV
jgi:hypothetical protein